MLSLSFFQCLDIICLSICINLESGICQIFKYPSLDGSTPNSGVHFLYLILFVLKKSAGPEQ